MEIVQLGEEVLRTVAKPVEEVTDEIRAMISEMFELMIAANGCGLAAPQIGKSLRFFVLIADDEVRRVFINPQIIATSQEEVSYEEGCLSLPKFYEKIVRPKQITVQALDENGKPFTLEADGFLARVIQHEYDHLEGILFIDRGDPTIKLRIEQQFEMRVKRRADRVEKRKRKFARIEAKKIIKEDNMKTKGDTDA